MHRLVRCLDKYLHQRRAYFLSRRQSYFLSTQTGWHSILSCSSCLLDRHHGNLGTKQMQGNLYQRD